MPKLCKFVGGLIFEAMRARKFTVAETALRLGISRAYLYRILTGKAVDRTTGGEQVMVCRCLECDVEVMIEEGFPPPTCCPECGGPLQEVEEDAEKDDG